MDQRAVDGLGFVEGPCLGLFHPKEEAVVGPGQFWTQCVQNRVGEIEGPHLGQSWTVETLAKFGLKATGKLRNEGLAVLGPLLPLLLLLDDDPPDLPIGRHHRRIDGTVGPQGPRSESP